MTSSELTYNVLVIGAGINGLAAAYHLVRLGCRRIGVVEQFRRGHDRGSSHGHSRITRSTYAKPEYVRLMTHVREEEWPRLERDTGRRLIVPCNGCFFGPGALFETYSDAVQQAGADVERLDTSEAGRRFPQFRFDNCAGVLHDHTAGIIAAADTLMALSDFVRAHSVVFHEETTVTAIDRAADPINVHTNAGTLRAERLVVTAGPWAAQLLPALRPRLQVARQTIGYFTLRGDREHFELGRFPVWVYLGDGEHQVHYGLPQFGRPGIKLARHVTGGRTDDPDTTPSEVNHLAIEELSAIVTMHFRAPIERLEGAEHCLYTNTPTEDFIVDLDPTDSRIAIGAGFSGHGFKFGPLTGRILAEAVLNGKTSVPMSDLVRRLFGFPEDRAIGGWTSSGD